MAQVVMFLHGGIFERAVHSFHLAIGIRMIGLGEPMADARLRADTIEDAIEGLLIARPVGELDAVIGQHRVDLVEHGGDQAA